MKIRVTFIALLFIIFTAIFTATVQAESLNLSEEELRDFIKTVIKENPNYFGLHITNFSCGADSFLEHFYKYIMEEKPYLILELDEHSAVAGMMTRLEAFRNVIRNSMRSAKIGLRPDLKVSN